MNKNNIILIAELVGTFLLTMAVLMGVNPFVAFGILVLLVGGISGANLNPAVSIGLTSIRKMTWPKMASYWVAQLAGALIAKVTYEYISSKDMSGLQFNITSIDTKSLVVEVLGSAIFLMGLVLALNQGLRGLRLAVAFGGSLFLGAMLGGVINPFVALALDNTSVSSLLGPLVGGMIGAYVGSMMAPHLSHLGLSAQPTVNRPVKARVKTRRS